MKKISTQITVFALMMFATFFLGIPVVNAQTGTATVSTDKLDYPPGSTAIISGKGFKPNEVVTLQVLHVGDTGDDSTSGAHAPWIVSADAFGNISAQWYVPLDQDELGATLKLTADGQTSKLHAEWTFTDAANTTTTIAFARTSSVYGSEITFTINTKNGSNGVTSGTLNIYDNSVNPTNLLTAITYTTTNTGLNYTYKNSIIAAGSHTIIADFVGDNSFKASQGSTSNFTIAAKAITVSADAGQSKFYGATDPAFAYTPSEALASGNSFTGALSRAPGETVAAGPYAYTLGTLSAGSNYSVTLIGTNKFAIKAKAITVSADAGQSKFYGATDPAFAYTPSEALTSGNSFTGALSRAPGETVAAGPYAYTLGTLSAGSNYSVTLTGTNTFAIKAKAITVSADAGQSKFYGATDPAFAYTPSEALASGNSFTGALSRAPGETVAAGPYAYTLGTLSAGSNYSVTLTGTNSFAITAKPVIVTPIAGQSKVYGAADPTFTYSNNASLTATDFSGALGRIAGENVATSPYNYTLGTLSAGTNYSLSLGGTNSFAITAKPVIVTPIAGQSKVYGAADPTFTYSNNASLTATDFSGALGRIAGENVATSPYNYTLGTLSAGTNYSLSLGGTNSFAITAKPVIVTPIAGQSKVYGAADPTFTYSNNASLTATDFSGALGRIAGENVATSPYNYTLGTLSAGTNYSLSLGGTNSFAITAKPVIVTPIAGQSKVYGAADPTFTYSNNASLTATDFSGALGRIAGENVATSPYNYTLGTLSAGTNYSLSLGGTNSFAITAKPVIVTPIAGQSKVYGAADPTFTYSNNASLTATDFSGALGRIAGENVATSPYNYTLGTLSAGTNYSLSLGGTNSFAITAKPVIVTPIAGQSKVYGAADPTFTYSNNASLTATDFSGALGRVAGENVATSPYDYTLGTLSAGTNYSLSLGGTNSFAITAKPVIVTPIAGQSKVYGAADPTFTYSNNASLTATDFSGALGRIAGENVATSPYNYTLGTLSAGTNYSLSLGGTNSFAITAKPVIVTPIAGQSKVYGAADPTFTYSNNASLTATDFSGALGRIAGENVATSPYNYTLGTLSAGTNYSLSLGGTNSFAITAKPVIVTPIAGQSKVYGAADPTFTYSNNASLTATDFSGALGRIAGENVATSPYNYTLGTLSAGTNYSLSLGGTNSFAITAKPVIVTPIAGQSKVYGAADPTFTYSNNASLTATDFSGALGRIAGENVATSPYDYTLGTLSAGTNYSLSLGGTNSFAITAKPVIVTPIAGQSKVYGAADPTFTYSNNASLTATDFSGALGRVAGENVATSPYDYTLGTLSAGTNYSLSLGGTNSFAITAKPVIVTPIAGQSKVYGAADPTFTYSNNASLTATDFSGALGRIAGENVATSPYNYTLGTLSAGTNYSLSLGGTNSFAITAKPVIVTPIAGQSKVYGAADPTFTYSNNASLTATDFSGALGRIAGENVATSPYNYTLGTLSAGTNYSLSLGGTNSFAITAKPVIVTPIAGQSKVYGAADPTFTYSNNASLTATDFSGALGRIAGENVATSPYNYTLGTLSAGTNYSLSLGGTNSFAITAKPVIVTPIAGQSKVYGAADPTFTYSNNASLTATDFSGALGRIAGENVATSPYNYTLGTLSAGTNYSLSLGGTNSFAITAKPVIVTPIAGQSKVYGAADPTFTYSNNASLTATDFSGALGRVAGENVATSPYDYTLGTLSAGTNYSLSLGGTNSFAITAKPVIVTPIAGQSKVYGAADPTFTYSNNASLTATDFSGALGRIAGENVATSPYNYTLGTLSAGTNYSLSLGGTNSFAITAKPVIVTPIAGQSKVYGAADPTFTYSNNASLTATDFSGALGRIAGENVATSPYNYTLGTLSAGTNYSLSLGGTNSFAITAKPVIVTPIAGQSKVYGAADPTFTYSNNASLTATDFSGALGRIAGENVATSPYNYTLGTLSAGTNYSLSLGGTNSFAITAKPVIVTPIAGQSKVYGAADPTFTYSNNASLTATDFSGALGRVAGENVATSPYDYTLGTLSAGTNYSLSLGGTNSFAITAKPVIVTPIAGQSKVYGAADPTFTYSNNASLTATDFSGALGRIAGENVATSPYNYTLGTLSAGTNYSLSLGGTNSFAITAKPVIVTPIAGQSKVYGAADPTFTYSNNASLTATDFSGALGRIAGENVATSPYNYTLGTLSAGTNYSLSLGGTNSFAITAKPVIVTPIAGQSKVYGAADPTFTYSNNASLTATDFSGALGRIAGENVATSPYNYTLGTLSAGTNYSLSLGGTNSFAITAKPVIVTPIAGQSKVYGAADPTFTYSNNASLTATDFSGALGRVAGENVATSPYDYTLGTLSAGTNYSLSLGGTNSFAITAKPVIVTPIAGQSKVYGAADPTFTYSNNASLTATDFSGALGRIAGENVATSPYNYTLGTLSAGTNYSLSLGGTNSFAITAKPVIVTPIAGQSKVYGAADPTFTYSNNASLTATDFSGALGRIAGENVATSPYNYTLGTLSAGTNYSLSLGGTNSFAITAKPVIVTPIAGQSKVYGAADPTFTYSNNASLTATDFSGALGRVAGENVATSPYNYTLGTLSAGTNYSLSLSTTTPIAQFTITPKTVVITPKAGQSKYCGQSDPTFTFSNDGGLTSTDFGSTKLGRIAGEDVKTYTYTLGTLSAGSNYSLSPNLGGSNTFEIKGVSIDASLTSGAIQLGTPTKTLSATVTDKNIATVLVPNATVNFIVTTYVNGASVEKLNINSTTDNTGIATYSLNTSSLPVGLYAVTAKTVNGCASTVAYFSVFDPNAGFVTGGGWITSPAGAYTSDQTLAGKANFGFNAQYKKGNNTPDGNTEFQFNAAGFNFKSTSYSTGSLVIAGARAIFQGTGTVNGAGNFNFMISAIDGSINGGGGTDKFRIKIWDAGGVVYDNNKTLADNADPATVISGGSIVIHSTSGNNTTTTAAPAIVTASAVAPTQQLFTERFSVTAYPNPTVSFFTIKLSSGNTRDAIAIRVIDEMGRLVEMKNNLAEGQTIQIGQAYRSGIYFVEVMQGNTRRQLKLIKNK